MKSTAIKIRPVGDGDSDFDLVYMKDGYPYCRNHGAMHKMSEFKDKPGGLWRCSVTSKTSCRAGCIGEPDANTDKEPSKHWTFAEKTAYNIARLECEDEIATLRNALEALVQLKDWKDKHGKDEHYNAYHQPTWDKARAAIAPPQNIDLEPKCE